MTDTGSAGEMEQCPKEGCVMASASTDDTSLHRKCLYSTTWLEWYPARAAGLTETKSKR